MSFLMEDLFIERVPAATAELVEAFIRLMPQLTSAAIPGLEELQNIMDSDSTLVVARYPGALGPIVAAGTLGVFRTPSGLHAHVEDIVVDSSLRGHGIGQALVENLLQIAREMGLPGVSLTCNPRRVAANRLYQKMGFKKWDTNTYWYEL